MAPSRWTWRPDGPAPAPTAVRRGASAVPGSHRATDAPRRGAAYVGPGPRRADRGSCGAGVGAPGRDHGALRLGRLGGGADHAGSVSLRPLERRNRGAPSRAGNKVHGKSALAAPGAPSGTVARTFFGFLMGNLDARPSLIRES